MQLKDTQLLFRAAIRGGNASEQALLDLRFHTRIGMTFYNPRNPSPARQREQAVDQHDDFIARIEAGDADFAAALAIAHWELSRAEIERFVTPQGMDIPLATAPPLLNTKGAS